MTLVARDAWSVVWVEKNARSGPVEEMIARRELFVKRMLESWRRRERGIGSDLGLRALAAVEYEVARAAHRALAESQWWMVES